MPGMWTRSGNGGHSVGRAADGGANLQQRFDRLDRNGDGTASREELPNQALFDRLDADGDGFVTLNEAQAGFGDRRGRQAR